MSQQQRLSKKQRRKLRQDGVIDAEGRFRSTSFSIRDDIKPLTDAQRDAFDAAEEGYNLILHGCAGTGKSFIGIYLALKELMNEDSPITKVITIRSAVPTRDIGFQPGTKTAKESVYESPYPPICNQIFGRGDAYQLLVQKGMYEFTSTSFLRSMTYDNTYIVVDEAQSMTYHELSTIITRAGKNTKIIFCGDTNQNDLIMKRNDKSGLSDFMRVLHKMDEFEFVDFLEDDIVRSGLVKSFLITEKRMKDAGEL